MMSLTPLCDITLRDSSILNVRIGKTGLAEIQPSLESLLATSGFPDLDIIYRLLTQTEDDGSVQRHFFGFRNDELVAFLKYDASAQVPYICSLGYVYTAEESRGLGIAENLCKLAIKVFAQEGGRAAYLSGGVPENRVYRRVGFKDFNGHIMRCVIDHDEKAYDAFYFAGRPISIIRDLCWRDWAMAAALYGQPTKIHIQDYGIQLYSGEGQEVERFQSIVPMLMRRQEAAMGITKVAEDSSGHLVGISTLHALAPGHSIVDFHIHPTAQASAQSLLSEVVAAAQKLGHTKIVTKIAQADSSKLKTCQNAGARVLSDSIECTGKDRAEVIVEMHF